MVSRVSGGGGESGTVGGQYSPFLGSRAFGVIDPAIMFS
jgi:hypothetical protein